MSVFLRDELFFNTISSLFSINFTTRGAKSRFARKRSFVYQVTFKTNKRSISNFKVTTIKRFSYSIKDIFSKVFRELMVIGPPVLKEVLGKNCFNRFI